MTKEQMGKRLRALRLRKGLTQKDFAQIAGVDYTYIGKIERGEQFPSLKVLIRFVQSLSLSLDSFFIDEATWRLINLIPPDIHTTVQKENLWELLRLLEDATEGDLSLLVEIVKVLKKHKEIRRVGIDRLPMVAEPAEKYKSKDN